MQNSVVITNRVNRGRIKTFLLCLLGLALALGMGGCQTFHPPRPLGKRAEKAPKVEVSKSESYYHYLKAQRYLLDEDIQGAIREYQEAAKFDPYTADLQIELAILYQRHGELTKALAHVEKALKIDPKNQEAHFLLAGLHVGLNQLKEAIQSYERVLVLNPNNREARLFLATLYAQQRRFPEAISTIQEFLKRDPNLAVGYYYLGRFYLEMNQLEKAKRELSQALIKDPQFIPAMFDLAGTMEQEKQYSRALAMYRRILQQQPNSSRAWAGIGRLYLITGKEKLAARAFLKVKYLEKDSPAALLQVGLIMLEQKYYADAIREMRQLLTQPQYKNQARYFIGNALEEKGEPLAAEQMYQGVERPSEFYVPARLRLAYLYFQEKKKDQARRVLEEIKTMAPDREEVYLTIAYFYEEEGLWHRAIFALEEGLKRLPKSAELYSRLALLYEKQNNRTESIKLIKKALELDPENPDMLNFLGYSYAEEGTNLDEAERLILKALGVKPQSGQIIDSLGWVYYKKGQYDKAVKELERAYHLLSTDSTVAEHLGDAYLRQNRLQDALRMYKKAMYLENPDIRRLRQKIESLEHRMQHIL
jgi:tetratricopeptide (TPR) repeat protein